MCQEVVRLIEKRWNFSKGLREALQEARTSVGGGPDSVFLSQLAEVLALRRASGPTWLLDGSRP